MKTNQIENENDNDNDDDTQTTILFYYNCFSNNQQLEFLFQLSISTFLWHRHFHNHGVTQKVKK